MFIASASRVYVADSYHGRVVVISGISAPAPGTQLYAFFDTYQGYFPTSTWVDSAGLIYVVDDNNNRVAVLQGLPAATALGDPQSAGFLGQSYQVHGLDGGVYSVLSSASPQFNARFTFLSSGQCPEYGGAAADSVPTNCFSHPGTYFSAVGFRTAGGSRLLLVGGAAKQGFASIVLDNCDILPKAVQAESSGDTQEQLSGEDSETGLNVKLIDRHHVEVRHSLFNFVLDSSDGFINLLFVRLRSWSELVNGARPHGLLGQSWRRLSGTLRGVDVTDVEGRVDDYLEADGDLFGHDAAHVRFIPGALLTESAP